MDTRAEKPGLCPETNKKRHFQRIRSPSRYTRIYRPRFEVKNFRSRFRFFRSMEERFIHRPHFALRYQRHHTGHWSNLQLSRKAKASSSSSSSGLRRHMEERATDIRRPSSGDTTSLSFTKSKKRAVTCAGVRTRAIQKKQEQIEEVYRQDCDTFGMVVKMLVAKDPSLEKPIQLSLRENLRDIGTRCTRAMEQFIQEYDSREPNAPSASKCFLSTED